MLIGLTGKAGSGKDTFADCLSTARWNVDTYALASPIKNVINDLFGWDERHSDGYLKEVKVAVVNPTEEQIIATIHHHLNVTPDEARKMLCRFDAGFFIPKEGMVMEESTLVCSPREAYQFFGTEVGRATRETLWLDEAQRVVDACDTLIITDVRFDNEAEWVKAQGGTVVKIIRDDAGDVNTHSSEAGVSPYYYSTILVNDGTQAQLHPLAVQLWDQLNETK